jgi:uncharacterized OB-fold protein
MPTSENLKNMLPPITELNRGFWEGTVQGELRLQYGPSGIPRFPESPVDPVTLETDSSWRAATGSGTLWSWIVMHQKYFPAFSEDVPYLVALIKLDEGPMIMSTIVDAPVILACDLRVEVVFEPLNGDYALPKFRVVS